MSTGIKKAAPQTNPQDTNKNLHKAIITDNCGFVNRELVVDNFAGGGGASTGIEQAIGRSVDIAINHDPDAIAMHKTNHPGTKHYCENVWDVEPVEACDGHPVGLAWFSPDCTHFSRAKGGKPVDKNIRGLAWVTLRWALEVRPRVIMLENVPEIQTWGPLGADGRPIKERAGETFDAFCCMLGKSGYPRNSPAFLEMCEALNISPDSQQARTISDGLGYDVQYRILKSCDYGAPTTRTRFYMIARCDDELIVFPRPTHGAGLKPYHTAAEIIDWNIPAKSIFERDKPLAENTLKRIARGIKKFVIDNPEPYIVGENAASIIQYHSETSTDEVRGQELTEPLMTVDTSPRYALSVAHIMKNYGGGYKGAGSAADKPLGTITAVDHNELVTAHILTMRNHMDGQRIDEPLGTVSCSGHGKEAVVLQPKACKDARIQSCNKLIHAEEVQAFLVKYFSTGTAKPVTEPLDTITTKERFGLVTIHGEDYIITDIRMRMLTPRELFRAQGFPEDYIIDHDSEGNQYPKSKQVARCGNAVTPPVPCALVKANLPEMCGKKVVA